jgi:RNA polymerase-binding transcription factor DksA
MKDLKLVEETLENRLAELTKRMELIDHSLGAPGDDDFEEMATEAENDETLEAIGHASEEEVAQIKFALERVKNGVYGICSKCGNPIPDDRLDAVPYATRCVGCAS